MKISLAAGLIFLASAGCVRYEAYPANNSQFFTDGRLNQSYVGKIVAVEGQVSRIEPGYKGKPLLQLTLAAPAGRTIWVGSVFTDSTIKVGHLVRALGYLSPADPGDTVFKGVSSDQNLILAYCIFDLNNKQGLYLDDATSNCQRWQEGALPGTSGEP